jgi:hypothetical protein
MLPNLPDSPDVEETAYKYFISLSSGLSRSFSRHCETVARQRRLSDYFQSFGRIGSFGKCSIAPVVEPAVFGAVHRSRI